MESIKDVIRRRMKHAALGAGDSMRKQKQKPKPMSRKTAEESHWEYVDAIKTMEKGRREHRAKQQPGYKKAIKDMDEGRAEYRRKKAKKGTR